MSKVVEGSTNTARKESDVRGYPHFMTVWRGQTISVFGSQMAAFAISIWIYQETGSVIQFGAVIAAQLVPTIIFAPLAGVMVDRYHRKNVMLGSEVGLIAASVLFYALISAGNLTPTSILIFSPLIALFGSIHQIAYASSIPLLVPRAAYGRANGYVQLGINGSAAIVPLISVYALETLGLKAVILLNIVTYLAAAISLTFARFMDKPASAAPASTGFSLRGLLAQQTFGLRYMLVNRTLLVLIMFLGAVSFLNGIVLVLFRPMILAYQSSGVLGWLVTIAGIGGLAGAICAAMFSARGERVRTLLIASAVSGTSMALCGLSIHYASLAVLAFVFAFSAPFTLVSAQTLMQTITPVDIQGRVFASRSLVAGVALIIAVIVSPQLSEHVFEPLMDAGRLLEPFARWLDLPSSGGMRMVFMLAGLAMVALAAVAARSPQFRMLRQQAEAPAPPLEVPAFSGQK